MGGMLREYRHQQERFSLLYEPAGRGGPRRGQGSPRATSRSEDGRMHRLEGPSLHIAQKEPYKIVRVAHFDLGTRIDHGLPQTKISLG